MFKELWSFLISVICGATMSTMYDVVKVRRSVIKNRKLWSGVEDVVFWSICAILVFVVVLLVNDGLFRAYLFIGMLIGAGAYKKIFSKTVVTFFATIILFLCKFVKKTFILIINVLKWVYKLFNHKRKNLEVQK